MSMVTKIQSMLKGHEDKAARGIDMAGRMVDRRTRGKYGRHIGKAQRKLKDELGRPPQGGQPGVRPGQGPESGRHRNGPDSRP